MAVETLNPGISKLDFRFVGKCTSCLGRFRWGLDDALRTRANRTASVIICPTPDCAKEKIQITGIPVQVLEK